MKKTALLLFAVLLSLSITSCHKNNNESSKISDNVSENVSETVTSQISEKPPITPSHPENSLESSSKSSIQTSEVSNISENASKISEYSKKIIEKAVDINKLGEQSQNALKNILQNENIFMNVNGNIALFRGVSVSFQAEMARGDNGIMEKFTVGENSVKIIQNSEGTFLVDDKNQTVSKTGGAYSSEHLPEIKDTESNYTQNDFANQIISYISSSFGLSSLKYSKNGSENYNGKNYDFDEYSADDKIIKVYFENNLPVYIVSYDEDNKKSVIEITDISSSPDISLFTLPESYKMTED